MAYTLEPLYEELKAIKTYLIKIGPDRRQGKILEKKLYEAEKVFEKYNEVIQLISNDIKKGKVGQNEKILIDKFCLDFVSLYKQIEELCSIGNTSNNSQNQDIKMESFNLKVALSLLPMITTENECSYKQLIDNIEYYSSLLVSDECKKNLIQFVLKSRLSQHAKLQLKSDYATVADLITDMRTVLLPQKSPIAIQNKIQQLKQNELSIEDYGNRLSELFMDLTVSQAKGDLQTYKILKPLNEKFVIKRFSDGLRNRRLSTIVAARNYESMKDAIQGAKDEETSTAGTSSGSGEILGMYSPRGRQQNYRGSRNNYFSRSYFNRHRKHDSSSRYGHHNHRGSLQVQQQSRGATERGQGSSRGRGKSYHRNRGNQRISQNGFNNRSVQVLTGSENNETINQFFRE